MMNQVMSPRRRWPKTDWEREQAKKLVWECYRTAADENGRIQWADPRIKSQIEKLMYWAGGHQIRFQLLTNQMRESGVLPAIKKRRSKRQEKSQISVRHQESSGVVTVKEVLHALKKMVSGAELRKMIQEA